MTIKADAVDLAELPSGKKLQYVRDGKMGSIQFSSGGELPKRLRGGWTDSKNAQTAVDGYVAELEKLTAEIEAEAEEDVASQIVGTQADIVIADDIKEEDEIEETKPLTAAEKRKATIAAKKATATEE